MQLLLYTTRSAALSHHHHKPSRAKCRWRYMSQKSQLKEKMQQIFSDYFALGRMQTSNVFIPDMWLIHSTLIHRGLHGQYNQEKHNSQLWDKSWLTASQKNLTYQYWQIAFSLQIILTDSKFYWIWSAVVVLGLLVAHLQSIIVSLTVVNNEWDVRHIIYTQNNIEGKRVWQSKHMTRMNRVRNICRRWIRNP